MHRALVLVLSLTLTSCLTTQQQQERQKLCMDTVAQMNEELTEREYATHTKQRDDDFAEFKSKLAMARSGLIARERGDCCCTGAELPPGKDCETQQGRVRFDDEHPPSGASCSTAGS